MISANPKVSVLIPTYNRSAYLGEAIQSVLNQSLNSFELIICDNCSTDNTAECVAEFKDERINFVKNNRNLGAVGNYNKALRLARGEYVYLFSDDDVMMPDNLQKKASVLDSFPSVGVVHSNCGVIDSDSNVMDVKHWTNTNKEWKIVSENPFMSSATAFDLLFNHWFFISMPTIMLRNSILEHNNFEFNNQLKYIVDWDLCLKMSEVSDFYYINEQLILYRYHSGSESSRMIYSDYLLELLMAKISAFAMRSNLRNNSVEKEILSIYTSTLAQTAWMSDKPKRDGIFIKAMKKMMRIFRGILN